MDVYERVIGRAFEHVAVSSRLKADAVAAATRPQIDGTDVLAQACIKREREGAALRFAKDRDLGRLEATMAGLDAEVEAAVVRLSRIPTAAEARAYLESLPDLWAKTSDAGRHAIAEAVFERIDVLGANDFTFALTAQARARGWDAALGPGVVRVKEGQSGRGEEVVGARGIAPPPTTFRSRCASPSLQSRSTGSAARDAPAPLRRRASDRP